MVQCSFAPKIIFWLDALGYWEKTDTNGNNKVLAEIVKWTHLKEWRLIDTSPTNKIPKGWWQSSQDESNVRGPTFYFVFSLRLKHVDLTGRLISWEERVIISFQLVMFLLSKNTKTVTKNTKTISRNTKTTHTNLGGQTRYFAPDKEIKIPRLTYGLISYWSRLSI